MEVKSAFKTYPEIAIEVDSNAADITSQLNSALTSGGLLELTDTRGRVVVVPAATIGYLEIGPEETRKVGFGSL